LAGIALLLGGFCAMPLSIPFLAQHRALLKRMRASILGARFVRDRDVVLQAHGNDCGAASLKMILAAHGVECSVGDLAKRLRLTSRGTSMLDLRLTAFALGVPARSWFIRPADMGRIPLPAIAFVNRDHFVVIRRFVAADVLEVDDPALGKLQWPMRAFAKVWSGEMLIFDPAWTPL
jgi:ABC-type bacteriocin/lantibiotic exporter with double-glycine peptidase domain